jgi:hypothetical protein
LDVDGDGRLDIVRFLPGTTEPAAHFNQGGQFGDAIDMGGAGFALVHTIVASDTTGTPTWEIRSDMIDLDGDGIPEGVDFSDQFANPGHMFIARIPTPSQPPRLLATVDNHRGAVTTVSYASMVNTATVEQHPETGKSMPHTQWVVKSLNAQDALAGTSTSTSYYYINPRFAADDRGRYGFRGFEEIDTTLPSGAKRVDRFNYAPDWSGRLVATLVHPAEGRGALDRADDLGGASTVQRQDQDLSRHRHRAPHLRERPDRGDLHGCHGARLYQDHLDPDRAREHDPRRRPGATLAADRIPASVRHGLCRWRSPDR